MTPRQSKATTAANSRLIELVKEAFAASEMSRDQLSAATGIPDGSLANILKPGANRPIYAEQLVALADALGASLDDWLAELRRVRDCSK